ncbi:MAG: hypothetical protein AAGC57_08990 [Pseudomonadota bacterium]
MAHGPIAGQQGERDQAGGVEPFRFSQEMLMAPALGAAAALWAMPMKAAFVVADEVLRESFRPWM